MTILTDAFLSSSKRQAGAFFYDANNLAIRIGRKRSTWQIKTRTSAETIGYFPMMSLAQARAVAAERAERIERGIPVTAAPAAKPTALLTLGGLMDRYELARQKDGLKSLRQGMAVLRNGFREFAKIELAAFTKMDMRAAHSAMSDGGRLANGNLFLRYACAMFNWAIHEDLIEVNWTKFVKRAKVKPRERVLTMDELAAIWLASEQLGTNPTRVAYGRMIRFLMLTGQRLDEAADLKHGAIVAGTWTQTENKASRRHTLRLSADALSEVGMGTSPHQRVFGSRSGSKITNTMEHMKPLRALAGVADWSHHTLRHTMVTHLAEAGIPLEVTEALLNHKLGGVAGVYHHAKHEGPKRDALKLWAEMIARQVEVARHRKAA